MSRADSTVPSAEVGLVLAPFMRANRGTKAVLTLVLFRQSATLVAIGLG
jgi:hypothetical protein